MCNKAYIGLQFIKVQSCLNRILRKSIGKILYYQYSQKKGLAIFVSVGLNIILFDKSQ